MSIYDSLLKNNLIDLDRLILDKYYLFDLDEVDCVLLIKIYNLIKQNEAIDALLLSKSMKIKKDDVAKRIVSLVSRDYLDIKNDDGKEIYSLDGLYKKIQEVMMRDNEKEEKDNKDNIIKEIAKYAVSSFNKVLTSIDLQTINHLVINDGFSVEEIKDAIDKCAMQRKYSFKYVDAYLQSGKKIELSHTDVNIEEKFENVFKKIK